MKIKIKEVLDYYENKEKWHLKIWRRLKKISFKKPIRASIN